MNLKSILLVSALGIVGVANANIVISQVYGGGGSTSTTTLQYDYIELQNNGATATSLNGLSLQYGSATGTGGFTSLVALPNQSLAAGQFFLIQGKTASAGGTALLADLTSAIDASATSGKFVLFNGTTLGGTSITPASTGVLDYVGYGTANAFEGLAAAPLLTNAQSDVRTFAAGLALDTNQNGADFTAVTTTATSFHNTTGVAQAVPEPSAFAALGLGVVAIMRRRRSVK